MVVPRTTRIQFLVVRQSFWLSVYLEQVNGVEFHSCGMKIYGCPSDNHISIFGCPTTVLVVPGARTTEFSKAAHNHTNIVHL